MTFAPAFAAMESTAETTAAGRSLGTEWPPRTMTSCPLGDMRAVRRCTSSHNASSLGGAPCSVAAITTSGTGGNGGPLRRAATDGATPASSAAAVLPGRGGVRETNTPGGSSGLVASTSTTPAERREQHARNLGGEHGCIWIGAQRTFADARAIVGDRGEAGRERVDDRRPGVAPFAEPTLEDHLRTVAFDAHGETQWLRGGLSGSAENEGEGAGESRAEQVSPSNHAAGDRWDRHPRRVGFLHDPHLFFCWPAMAPPHRRHYFNPVDLGGIGRFVKNRTASICQGDQDGNEVSFRMATATSPRSISPTIRDELRHVRF